MELYRFPRAHRKLYLPTWGWGCTLIVINKDNGSHRAHKQRQTGKKGGGTCERQGGERGTGQHDVCFVTPK